MNSSKRPPMAVYTIIDRRDSGRKHWVRIGAAFENRDGSLNIQLDALPLNGSVHVRELAPAEASTIETGARVDGGAGRGAEVHS
ncbi:MAG: hypothetical protein H5U40_11425 [Polyangiaceae bacterium]|nr:hypothetical protein [Polyangiaceae bacterium]